MRSSHLLNGLIAAAAFSLAASSAWADVLILTGGERRSGIVEDSPGQPDFIVLIDAGGKVTISRNRVAQIIREPKGTSLRAIGDQLFERQLYEEALSYYRDAQAADPNTPQIKERIQAVEAELNQRATEERKRRVLEIGESLRAAREAIGAQQFEQAQERLTHAEALGPDSAQAEELRSVRIQMLMAWGQDRLDKTDKTGAAEKFEAVRQLAPQHPQATEELTKIWENDRSKTEQLRALLEAKLKDDPNDTFTVKRLADIAYRERQYEQALPLYAKLYDRSDLKGTEVETRLQTILETLRNEADAKGDMDKAIKYHKELIERFPAAADPALLTTYDFRLRKSRIAGNDEAGWLELAAWAQEKNMDAQALELYTKVLNINPENEKALQAYEAYAQQRILEARDVFNQGEFLLARTLFDQVAKDFPKAPTAVAEAVEWSQKAQIKVQEMQRRNEDSAQRLVETGDRYYERALSALRLVTESPVQVREAPSITNPRRESMKYYRLAIGAYEEAMRLAPTLPEIASGEVRVKLKDAQDNLHRLENPIDYGLPRVNPALKR